MARGGKRPGAGRKVGSKSRIPPNERINAQRFEREAFDTLVEIMTDHEGSSAARVAAAKEVLDRARGKAPQAITGADGGALETVNRVVVEILP